MAFELFLHISVFKKYCYHSAMLTSVNLISFHLHSKSLKRNKNRKIVELHIVAILENIKIIVTGGRVLYLKSLCDTDHQTIENPNFEYNSRESTNSTHPTTKSSLNITTTKAKHSYYLPKPRQIKPAIKSKAKQTLPCGAKSCLKHDKPTTKHS